MTLADTAADGERHFSGIITRMVVNRLAEAHGPDVLRRVLEAAGEAGKEEELREESSWLSYRRLRALFEAVSEAVSTDELRQAATAVQLHEESRADMTQMLQDFGSPDNLLRQAMQYDNAFGVSTILHIEAEERAPGDWVLEYRFRDGFEPFREFCAFTLGTHTLFPTLFGLAAEVTEECCACDGAACCSFHLRWDTEADADNQKSYFETRSRLLEVRLGRLQETVVQLVSAPDPVEGLRRVLAATAQSVHVPAYLLAIDPAVPLAQRLHFEGLEEAEAVRLAVSLPEHVGSDTPGLIVVEVASTRATYGHLALVEPAARHFLPQERELVQSYAGLVAAALDSATALEEARRQATTAGTLLDLSSSLTELASTEEMALNLARAVPSVIDCDRTIVLVHDPVLGEGRVAATHGFPDHLARHLASVSLPTSVFEAFAGGVSFFAEDEIARFQATYGISLEGVPVAAASAPMVANGETIGALVVLATSRRECLRENAALDEALRGLAGQAAVAIRNARLVDQVRHQALHDGLTGLPNRTLVLDRLSQALARASREGTPVAALFIDLDGFKEINDTLGHAAGDRLLVALADRLQVTLRHSDTIGRLGGDEFVVVAEADSLEAGPQSIAERILEVVRPPFRLEGFEDTRLTVTTSVGVAVGTRESAGELLRDADIALYHAKERGKNCYAIYQPEMSKRVRDRMELENDIREAVERRQFFLLYQPFFDLRDGSVLGAEALIRWRHPRRGTVDAGEFVTLLEEMGAIGEVGRWVLDEAARQATCWHERGHRIEVSVNVSRSQLEGGQLVDDVAAALASSGLDPSALVIEVAESSITRHSPVIADQLRRLKQLGVKVAIDDFGTAYSSLAYLSRFPVDGVKIDRSFIASIDDSNEAGALIHVLLELGKTLGLTTFAEGIESSAQVSRLQEERCDGGQGFLLARPLTAEDLVALLAAAPSPAPGLAGRQPASP
ncbi:MAG: putative bifunctional diguanylate cyclase/phosphodiesterase [Acidimicrobiales bacterium]